MIFKESTCYNIVSLSQDPSNIKESMLRYSTCHVKLQSLTSCKSSIFFLAYPWLFFFKGKNTSLCYSDESKDIIYNSIWWLKKTLEPSHIDHRRTIKRHHLPAQHDDWKRHQNRLIQVIDTQIQNQHTKNKVWSLQTFLITPE